MNFRLLSTAVLLGTMVFSGCSTDDEPAEAPVAGNVISFTAVTPKPTRSAPTTTASMQEFVVYAFTNSLTLMDGVTVKRSGGSWIYSPEAYWPSSPVNFFAFSPDITKSTSVSIGGGASGSHISEFMNDGTVDLLYSVNMQVSQQAAPVILNFRHAMSKVTAMLSSNNSNIEVKVSHVTLKNIYRQGSFDFPDATTAASTPEVKGTWKNLQKPAGMLLFYAIGADDAVTLTPTPTDYSLNNLDASYVIPQSLEKVVLNDGTYSGTFLQVDCEIFDKASGVKIWPTTKTPDYLLVPETNCGRLIYSLDTATVTQWESGHAYVYNISIDNPDVLDKIEFDVSVDDYAMEGM